MNKPQRGRPRKIGDVEKLPAVVCEVCGVPYTLVQSHDFAWRAPPGTGYGAYEPNCTCERPAQPALPYDPDVPF